jgi:hypothetical protein
MISEPLIWQGYDAPQDQSRRPVVAFLTCLAVVVALMVSGFVLMEIGIPYASAGGNPLLKIHPMTYLAIIAFAAAALSRGNPLVYIAECAAKFPGTAYFIVILIIMIVWTLIVQRQPLTSLIDTFLPASLFVFLISDLTPRQHRLLTLFIHVAMNANAVLGIIEVTTGWRLTPIILDNAAVLWDWRASAFLGHPLENAMLSGVYLLMILFGADRSISPTLRIGIVVLQMLGLVVFGGRAAMVLAYAFVVLRVIALTGGVLRGRRFDARFAALIVMAVPIVIGAVLLAFDLGVFDRVIERFTNDGGSADTRVSILRIFNSFPLYDLLMGPDPDVLTEKTIAEGTLAGIESFVFGFFLQSGMLISIIFFCGLAAISYDLWRVGSRAGLIHIFYFYFVAAGAASLSVKGQTLVQFAILFTTVEAMPSLTDRDRS